MGFADLLSDAGLTMLDNWVTTRSYISGYVSNLYLHECHRLMMRKIWSVLMRRLKTPLYDYVQWHFQCNSEPFMTLENSSLGVCWV